MMYLNKFGSDILSNTILLHLNVMKALSGTPFWLVEKCIIVIVYDMSIRHEGMFNLEELKNLNKN
jgi:hypothetical protein